VVKFLGAI